MLSLYFNFICNKHVYIYPFIFLSNKGFEGSYAENIGTKKSQNLNYGNRLK